MIFIKNFILKSERVHFPIIWDFGVSFMSSKNQQNWNCRDHKTIRFARNVIFISSVHHFHLLQKLQSFLHFIQKIVKSCGCVGVQTNWQSKLKSQKHGTFYWKDNEMKMKDKFYELAVQKIGTFVEYMCMAFVSLQRKHWN